MKEIAIMRKIQNCLGILEKNTAVDGPQKDLQIFLFPVYLQKIEEHFCRTSSLKTKFQLQSKLS